MFTTTSLSWPSLIPDPFSTTLPESVIIQAAQDGDESAFALLVDLYHGAAQRVARRIMRTEEAAADAVQDSLIKAHRAIARYEDGNFAAWLMRIVTNTCYDHLRYQRRRPAISLDELAEYAGPDLAIAQEAEDVESVVVRREEMRTLVALIDQLPVWHREVLLLVDMHGYDYAEAADMLQLPLGTVKSRLSRARMALRDRLVEVGLTPGRTN